ncbi:hypothetical protein [Rivularia sp. UHCC 0363]|uniref:hypothetical protein n=1 Tax=Rivularia sp. UHCC 0363 TaxID=3110244 RepID=UPI002B2215AE|nr:hypothetical protein [Rivularia sp. UHCC 0363]MEA5594068.1 hypothetical protein [Rivularia sp. UHCC 0363]
MFDPSIVQSNTRCLLHSSCSDENQFQVEQLLEKQSKQLIIGSVEVDSVEDEIYRRVWHSGRLLRTFQRDVANDLWISQPYSYPLKPHFENSKDAVMFIVEMNAFVTA